MSMGSLLINAGNDYNGTGGAKSGPAGRRGFRTYDYSVIYSLCMNSHQC